MRFYAVSILLLFATPALADLPICAVPDRAARELSCISDGDTGWERGTKWGLLNIDAPEIDGRRAGCRAEQIVGIRSRDRMRALMSRGYTVMHSGRSDRYGRALVHIKLTDGRDAGIELLSEGLVQAWPNMGNRWCGR